MEIKTKMEYRFSKEELLKKLGMDEEEPLFIIYDQVSKQLIIETTK